VARAHFGGKGKRLPLTRRRLPEGALGASGSNLVLLACVGVDDTGGLQR
jgi:hypothetical protein